MNYRKLANKLLSPPVWMALVLSALSFVALILVFVKGWSGTIFSIVIYVLSFYTLCVDVLAFVRCLPAFCKETKSRLYKNKILKRYFTNAEYKTHAKLYLSLAINLAYATLNAVYALLYHTHWFAVLAAYYAILALMRFLLARYISKNRIGGSRIGELKRSRLCAYLLLVLNFVLFGAVLMLVYFDRGFEYRGFLIYVAAMHAFYVTGTAVFEIIKYRRYNSPVMSASKIVNLASALVSMLALETAMLSQFGKDMSHESRKIMIVATGIGIGLIIVLSAVGMIVSTTKEIRSCKNGK